MPFLQSPLGYDVLEASLAELDETTGVYKGNIVFGLPLFFKGENGALGKQAEFQHIVVAFNNPSILLAPNAGVYRQETEKLRLPRLFTARDTIAYPFARMDGVIVGKGIDRPGNEAFAHYFYVLNPSGRPVFVPVQQEKYIRFCIARWRLDQEEEKRKLEENAGYLQKISVDPNFKRFIPQYQEAGKRMQARIDLDESNCQASEQKLKSMTKEDLNAPAYDDAGAENKTVPPPALFMFNPAFYDRTMPRTAIQLMIIWDPASLAGIRLRASDAFMEQNFFDRLDFKALSELMNK